MRSRDHRESQWEKGSYTAIVNTYIFRDRRRLRLYIQEQKPWLFLIEVSYDAENKT